MAVVAHPYRGIDRTTDQARRRGDRLRIVFAEPDRLSPGVVADTVSSLDEETRAKLRSLPSNDQVMADAIKQSRVVLGEVGSETPVQPSSAQPPPIGVATLGGDAKPYLISYQGLLRNVQTLDSAAAGRGLFSMLPEQDGIVRRVPMVMLAQDTIVPSLTLEMLRVATGSSTVLIRMEHGTRHQERRNPPRPRDADRRQGAALGAFLTERFSALRLRHRRAGGPRHRRPDFAAARCWSARRPSGCSTRRQHRSIRSSRASKSTPRCWRTS